MKARHKRAKRAIRKANNNERLKHFRKLAEVFGERNIPIPQWGPRQPRVYHVPSSPSFTTVRGSTYVQVTEDDMKYLQSEPKPLIAMVPVVIEDPPAEGEGVLFQTVGFLPGWP